MPTARLTLDPRRTIADVPPRLFGSFVEHLGRCVYTGIFEPDHPSADENGMRRDVLDLVRELGVTIVRYPGGNFVSGYRWEDGVGPADERPARLDLAWHTLEPNTMGTDEFMAWCEAAGVEPMMAVNLGTRGVLEAVDLLDYCNGEASTALADERRRNGHEAGYDVRMWCLGNEMDGPWQVGHKTPEEYARIARETAHAMRLVDPDLELVACGSSGPLMPTFGDWERVVLTGCYDEVDFISLHRYYQEEDGDLASFLASGVDLDRFIEAVVATADHVGAVKGSDKRIDISVDEWNVWYQGRAESRLPEGKDWPVGPVLLEDNYNAADAVVVGGLLISLLKHCDRVRAAAQAQLVNVIAPIMTEPGGRAWRQTIFHPFALTARHARGDAIALDIAAPTVATTGFGEVPAIDAVATLAEDGGAVFLVNRDPGAAHEVDLDVSTLDGRTVTGAQVVTHDDPYVRNSADEEVVTPRALEVTTTGGVARCTLPAASWAVITLG